MISAKSKMLVLALLLAAGAGGYYLWTSKALKPLLPEPLALADAAGRSILRRW